MVVACNGTVDIRSKFVGVDYHKLPQHIATCCKLKAIWLEKKAHFAQEEAIPSPTNGKQDSRECPMGLAQPAHCGQCGYRKTPLPPFIPRYPGGGPLAYTGEWYGGVLQVKAPAVKQPWMENAKVKSFHTTQLSTWRKSPQMFMKVLTRSMGTVRSCNIRCLSKPVMRSKHRG
jgi:hypothetical protein